MRKLFVVASLILVFTACKKEEDGEYLSLSNSQELTQVAFADEENTNGFTFTAKKNWTATVKNVTSSKSSDVSWLKLLCNEKEIYSGTAGTFKMTILLAPNYSGQTRMAIIEIVSENNKTTVTVTQSGTTITGVVPLSEVSVYERIIALKEKYPEGMKWTNDNYYQWKGGIYSGGYGCVGFAFLLSDAAFGNIPARKHYDFNNLRIGDILRINGDTHSVILIGIDEENITFAEGNYNLSIHWGRKEPVGNVKSISNYVLTRYP